MARHRGKNMMKQPIRAWNGRSFMIIGFLIACIVGTLINVKVAKSKPEFEPEAKLMEKLLRDVNSLKKKTMSIPTPTQNCHFATSQGRRSYQEDRVTCDLNFTIPLSGGGDIEEVRIGAVAVFDGHIGSSASSMAARIFLDKFMVNLNNNSIEQSSDLKEILKSSLVTIINDIDAEFTKARTILVIFFSFCLTS
uniref:Putative ovule protein n=1 Tax=Solanum chacoense TaxID=4108 RepID=A0A0V0I6A0_SOLCH